MGHCGISFSRMIDRSSWPPVLPDLCPRRNSLTWGPGELLEPAGDEVAVPRVEFDQARGATRFLRSQQGSPRAVEGIGDLAAWRTTVLDQVGQQVGGLGRGMVGTFGRFGELQHCGLIASTEPGVGGPGVPSVETRFVTPVVVLPPQHEYWFDPDEALPEFEFNRRARSPQSATVGIGVPEVVAAAGDEVLHGGSNAGDEEVAIRGFVHFVVGDGEAVGGLAGVGNVVRRVGEVQVGRLAVQHSRDGGGLDAIAAVEPVAAKTQMSPG